MTQAQLYLIVTLIAVLLVAAVIILTINRFQKKNKGKSNVLLTIFGWASLTLSFILLAFTTVFLIIFDSKENNSVWVWIIVVFPAAFFIFAGMISLLSFGISSLIQGCTKKQDGSRDKDAIIRGAFLLFLSVIVIIAIVVCISELLRINASSGQPIAAMISLLWMISCLSVF